jgi:hypothetical protein
LDNLSIEVYNFILAGIERAHLKASLTPHFFCFLLRF